MIFGLEVSWLEVVATGVLSKRGRRDGVCDQVVNS